MSKEKFTLRMFPLKVRWWFFKANISYWFWWYFKATEKQKVDIDMFYYGTGVMKNGKRINPKRFWPEFNKETKE